ncbi:tropinone reductase homolog At2g29170-like [Zingiber officinale]|uniref:tropinone reductase homolog At2g29170-like n=1 Tax=Zingiber officinale TaxID=94328 RepID=UPI001C4AB87F|nr:tropinone reductase homolog At2g29170-like [Zingiber officinale]
MENGNGNNLAINAAQWSLAGKTLVNGGTKGIGYNSIKIMQIRGDRPVHTCARKDADLHKCLREWQAKGFRVNNAGTGFVKPMALITPEEYKFIMSTNVDSTFHMSQLAYPLLKDSGGGAVVDNSSLAGILGIDNFSIYGTAKAASGEPDDEEHGLRVGD